MYRIRTRSKEQTFDAIIDDAVFDEDHALDEVLNDMVADMTPDEIDEIANSKFEVEDHALDMAMT